jgi:hypothetical protein
MKKLIWILKSLSCSGNSIYESKIGSYLCPG